MWHGVATWFRYHMVLVDPMCTGSNPAQTEPGLAGWFPLEKEKNNTTCSFLALWIIFIVIDNLQYPLTITNNNCVAKLITSYQQLSIGDAVMSPSMGMKNITPRDIPKAGFNTPELEMPSFLSCAVLSYQIWAAYTSHFGKPQHSTNLLLTWWISHCDDINYFVTSYLAIPVVPKVCCIEPSGNPSLWSNHSVNRNAVPLFRGPCCCHFRSLHFCATFWPSLSSWWPDTG